MSAPATLQQTPSRWPLFAAIGLTLVAVALRLPQIRESLWLDELHTSWCAVGSLGEVRPRAAIGNQSPLFFWLEWLLVRVLGPSEISLRLPILVAGSLLPLAMYLLAQRWASRGVGLLAAALMTVDEAAIFFATEARPYAVMQLLAIVHIAITLELTMRPTTALRVSWIAVAALLFHLHYTAALVIAAEVAFWGVAALTNSPPGTPQWRDRCVDIALLAALGLPALFNLHSIFGRRANWAKFVDPAPLWEIFDWWPAALGLWFLLAAAVVGQTFLSASTPLDDDASHRKRLWLFVAILLCWLLVPAAIAWVSTQADFARLFFPRYVIASVPAAMLVGAMCPALAPWRWSKVVVGALMLSAALYPMALQVRDDGRLAPGRPDDWRGCVVWLNDQLAAHPLPILVSSGFIEADGLRQPHDELLEDYCLLPVTSLYPLDAPREDLIPLPLHEPDRLEQVAEMLVIHRGGAWLVVRSDWPTATRIGAALARRLERLNPPGTNATWRIAQSNSFGRVQVLLLASDMIDQGNSSAPSKPRE
jgi:mannosyltransferase